MKTSHIIALVIVAVAAWYLYSAYGTTTGAPVLSAGAS